MKLKKWSNLLDLVVCFALSLFATGLGIQILYGKCSVITIYLLCSFIFTVLFLLLSLNRKNNTEKLEKVEATVISSKLFAAASYTSTLEFWYKGKKYEINNLLDNFKPVGSKEKFYVNEEKEYVVREGKETLFKKDGFIIISLLAIVMLVLAIAANNIAPLRSMLWYRYEYLEIFGKVCVFKFMSCFLVLGITILHGWIALTIGIGKDKYNKIEGTCIGFSETTDFVRDMNGNDDTPTKHYYPQYEYTFNGKKYEYVGTERNKIEVGDKVTLYVDSDGTCVSDMKYNFGIIVFTIFWFAFYVIGVWEPIKNIIDLLLNK